MASRSYSIAIVGTRGVPASYGGFETFAEELGAELVTRGHRVLVYGRKRFGDPATQPCFRGIERRNASTIFSKYFETPLASFTSCWDVIDRDVDVVLLCNAANSLAAWMPRLFGIPVCINVDGIERRRKKWGTLGKLGYRLGEWCSLAFGSAVIADAQVISDYYQSTYGKATEVIAYGAREVALPAGRTLEAFSLQPGEYWLYVSRFEPENNAALVVEAFRKSASARKLVMVGDAPYAVNYKQQIYAAAADDQRIVFTGYQFGDAYRELRSHCFGYIQASEVGGTHPALVEGMAHGNVIVANDVPEHTEVLEDGGWYYQKNDPHDLASLISRIEALPLAERGGRQSRARELARQKYSWAAVTDAYERLFATCIE